MIGNPVVGLVLGIGNPYWSDKSIECLKIITSKVIVKDFIDEDFNNSNTKNIALNKGLDEISDIYLKDNPGSYVWVIQLDYGEIISKSFLRNIPQVIKDLDINHRDGAVFNLNNPFIELNIPKAALPQEIRLIRYNGSQYYWGGPRRYVSGVNNAQVCNIEINRKIPKEMYKEHIDLNNRLQNIKDRKSTPEIIFYNKVLKALDPE